MQKQYKDSNYIIYDDGRCYSNLSHKFLTPQMSTTYPTYNLTLYGKKRKVKVHRMVAETFLPAIPGKNIVNHKDGNTKNFQLSNLEWTDNKGNAQHALITGLKSISDQKNPVFLKEALFEEEWLPIKDYPNYLISSCGRVLNKNTNRLLKAYQSKAGYLEVNLWREGKGTTIRVHKLVYSHFYNDFNLKGFVINHKDGNKINNQKTNLEKITYAENNYHAEYIIKTHLCGKAVEQLDEKGQVVQEYPSIAEAQRQTECFGISRAISKGYKTQDYYWRFKDCN